MLLLAEDCSVWRAGWGARGGVRVTCFDVEAGGCDARAEMPDGVATGAAMDGAFGKTAAAAGAVVAGAAAAGGAVARVRVAFAASCWWAAWSHEKTPTLRTRTTPATTRFG